jgi:hypothetical protein
MRHRTARDSGRCIASIIASPCKGTVTVKILNTRFEKEQIKNFKPTMKPLVDYEICNFNREKIDSERVEKLLKILDYDGLNSEEQRAVQEIVAKYADVFYLENDPATHTEIY